MIKRLLIAAVIAVECGLVGLPACAQTIYVQLFPLTGEIRLRNKGTTLIDFIYYSIESPSGALNSSPSVWKSISDNYDVSGNGFIDHVNNWGKLAATSNELSEGVVPDPGGNLAGMRAISLGNVWNPNLVMPHDLTVEIRHRNGTLADVSIEYPLVAGDYSGNRVVDQADYNIWQQFYGSNTVLLADGNLDGFVDAADYVVWRDNLGKSVAGLASGSDAGTSSSFVAATVPEPASVALLVASAGGLIWPALRRRRRYCTRSSTA